MGSTNEGANWLEAFDDRAEEAAILAKQNLRIAACVQAAHLILEHPDSGKHEIKDDGERVRRQTIPVEVGQDHPVVIGEVLQGEDISLRSILKAVTADLSFLFMSRQYVYSRDLENAAEADAEPVIGRPGTAMLPSSGIRPSEERPNSIEGTFRRAAWTDDDITLFGAHVGSVAAVLDISLPSGDEFIGVSRAARLG